MKKLFFAMLALVALASCSKDEVVQLNQDEIKFSVVAENTTKAANVYCQNNLINSFKVWAEYTEDGSKWSKYFGPETMTKSDAGVWESTAAHYWPDLGTADDNKTLRFYAVAGATNVNIVNDADNSAWAGEGKAPIIKDFTPNTNVALQEDLLYAVTNTKVNPTNGTETLNFRHALSQIVFKAKNQNPNIYVEIYGVSVCNVVGTKTFTFNQAGTESQYIDHQQSTNVTISNQGAWNYTVTNQTTPKDKGTVSYEVDSETALAVLDKIDANDVTRDITAQNNTGKEYCSNAMLLLPQTTDAWEPSTQWPSPTYEENANDNIVKQPGTYFLLNCKIWNKSGNSVAKDNGGNITDVLLWDNQKLKDVSTTEYEDQFIAIPQAANWEQGKKYTYTFVFTTQGNGGYDPDPDLPDPDPVLTPIVVNVTVDDFTNGTSTVIDMNATGTGSSTTSGKI